VSKGEDVELLSIEGREVRITHPAKQYFSKQTKVSKLDLVRYYLSVAQGALAGIRDRPIVLKRFVNGAEGEAFYQKRAPGERPPWLRTVTLSFPSGRTAEEVVVDDAAGLAWIVNLGCIELHPHPVRSGDLDHPDELRVDLDPGPGVNWAEVRVVALEVKAFLEEAGLRGWPKTSGSRGMHINVRIQPRWTFTEVRRAAVALSRAVERRVPSLASSKWWKEERHGVFLDYNQNAKDRTTASAYSVRPLPDARVSTPLHWHEVPDCEPADFTILTVPRRFEELGDPNSAMDSNPGTLERRSRRSRGSGRRAMAAAFPEDGGRSSASDAFASEIRPAEDGGEEAAPHTHAAARSGEFSRSGRGPGRSGTVEAQIPGGGRAPRYRRCLGGLDAREVFHVDANPCESPPCARRVAPAAGDARPRRRSDARMA
jgi:DNA ligase D-like protein (predicted polymerase)